MKSSNYKIKKQFRIGSASVKKILIWAAAIMIILLVIFGAIFYLKKNLRLATPQKAPSNSQEIVAEQLKALDAIGNQFYSASSTAAKATVSEQLKALDALRQKSNSSSSSRATVQQQLQALDSILSK